MRALVCVLFGLGDAIMLSPMLRALKSAPGVSEVHTISAIRATGDYVQALPYVDNGEAHDFLKMALGEKHRVLDRYRRRDYDLVVLPYPAGRWQYHAAALFIGTGRLRSHVYWKWQYAASPLYATLLPVSKSHQVDINLELLGEDWPSRELSRQPEAPREWRSSSPRARCVMLHLTSLDSQIGKGNHLKAWPIHNFVTLAKWLHGIGYDVCTIGTGAELEIAEHFERMCGFRVSRVSGTLKETALALSEATALVSNDSGIAHLGAALGVPTLTLFGMTDPAHLAPIGKGEFIRTSDCPPCFIPQDRRFRCVRNVGFSCIRKDISLGHVISRLSSLLGTTTLVSAD